MEYIVDGKHFILSYQEIREHYSIFCGLTDQEFKIRLPEAIHLACVICFLKEIPTYICLSDCGIVHELAHALTIGENNTTTFSEIRKLFEEQLKLS